jgi:hypothetical protein
MNEPLSRGLEFDRENNLYELFISSNDLSVIKSHQTKDISWFMAFGRYLKINRINSDPLLYQFIKDILNENLSITRGLFLILKQCVYLYPDKLIHLSFQRHLSIALTNLTDTYVKYKYVRLLRLIIDKIEEKFLPEILPSTTNLLENYSQLDISIIIVLEKLVLINSDSQLQLSLNQIYNQSLIKYLKSNDFDDDEIIDLCYLLFQINLNKSFDCIFNISTIFIDLLTYIDYDTDTMMNWLLTPETGEKFLIFILRLMKYLSSYQEELKSQSGDEIYNQLTSTIKRFHDQLKNAYEKSLFPYNIKPLLNVLNLF